MIVFFFFLFDEETGSTVQVPVEGVEDLDEQELVFFFDEKVRKVWHKQEEQWYFSIVDVISILTDSSDPKQYIKKMKLRDSELNSNWGTICTPIQMKAADGKNRNIQAANTAGILRINTKAASATNTERLPDKSEDMSCSIFIEHIHCIIFGSSSQADGYKL